MDIALRAGRPFIIHSVDATTVYPASRLPQSQEWDVQSGILPLDTVVSHLRNQLLNRRFHSLGMLEIRYECFPEYMILSEPEEYSSHYLLIDASAREIVPYLQVVAKGSLGN